MSGQRAGTGAGGGGGGALDRIRRRYASPSGPPSVATGLALVAVIELLVRGAGLHTYLPIALLLGVCCTLPLALVLGVGGVGDGGLGGGGLGGGFSKGGVSRPASARSGAAPLRAGAALALTAANTLALGAADTATFAGIAAQVTAVYHLGRSGAPRLTVLLVLPYVALALAQSDDATARTVAVLVATFASAAAATGISRRARREAQERSVTRQAFADTLLAHAARGERARIARELHDVVAHHISMISVQAETARLTTPGLPADGARRLLAIGDTARLALTEMRRLLGVLREDAEDAGSDVAARQPQPGLEQLMGLLDEARDASGTAARLIVSGTVTPLDPGIELTAYRIVQEALTNARRHARGSAVDVELRYGADALELRVRDTGPGPSPGPGPGPGSDRGSGHGLLGMRERTTAAGGELHTGAAPGGGFLVVARLPVRGGEPLRGGGLAGPRPPTPARVEPATDSAGPASGDDKGGDGREDIGRGDDARKTNARKTNPPPPPTHPAHPPAPPPTTPATPPHEDASR